MSAEIILAFVLGVIGGILTMRVVFLTIFRKLVKLTIKEK